MNDSSSTNPNDDGGLKRKPSTLSKADYLSIYGGIYEASPWIAESALEFGAADDLDTAVSMHKVLKKVVDHAPRHKQLNLIRAHPALAVGANGARILSSASQSEQSGAGLDNCSAEELQAFQALNTAYKEKFGFPFVLAIKGKDRHEILSAFRERLNNDLEAEFAKALQEIHKIAYRRLIALSA